jgi:predicted nucleotidyltransferase
MGEHLEVIKSQVKKASEEELQQLRQKLLPIFQHYHIQKAIVFGSFARGEATRHSDLDLILIQQTDKRFFDRYEGILADLGMAVGNRELDVLIYTPAELNAISQRRMIASALREGKVIYESG